MPQEAFCDAPLGSGFQRSHSQERGCNTKGVRVPFDVWLPHIAAALKTELAPLFQEFDAKLNGVMENVRDLFVQQSTLQGRGMDNNEHIVGNIWPPVEAAEFESCQPAVAPLATWQEPDQMERPQAPQQLELATPQRSSMIPFREEYSLRHSRSEELQAPTPDPVPQDSEQIVTGHSRKLLADLILPSKLRKSMEQGWMNRKILETDYWLSNQRSLRRWIATHLGVTSEKLSGADGGFLLRLVRHRCFGIFWTVLIMADAVESGFAVHAAQHQGLDLDADADLTMAGFSHDDFDLVISSVFLVEIILRVCAWKWAFILGKDSSENILETSVVVFSFVAAFLGWKGEYASLLRSLRFTRVFRQIMTSSNFLSLRFMLSSMAHCLPFLTWAFLLIFLLVGYFAVVFLTLSSHWLKSGKAAEQEQVKDGLRLYFAGWTTTVNSLFMAVTGGIDYREMWEPLHKISPVHGLAFLFYIYFMVLGVFNVLVGICADRAFSASKLHHDYIANEEEQQMKGLMREVREIFFDMDAEAAGAISQEHFLACEGDSRMQSFLKSHQMHMVEPRWLFGMLDTDGDGRMTLPELTVGLMRLSGQARSSDVLLLLTLTQELREDNIRLANLLEKKLGTVSRFQTSQSTAEE